MELNEKLKKSDEENERLKEMNNVQTKLWKVWLKEYESKKEEVDNRKIERIERGKKE